ncbi:nitrate/nitrite transporter NrtS [Pseudoalteromonas sp. L1]|uniref:nitrate/nitrite transporter NrtS n=1 Tax=unclassified Pseudoalteromonas TaxID=194690 RepID=UPI001F191F8D|nr:nitrate/nitrite transporter NrtS [Pseudoalteromonas sp. L1]
MIKSILFLKVAFNKRTLVTGFKTALIVGIFLNIINQGDLILSMKLADVHWLKLALTFCVPFFVSVYSATIARLRFDPGTRAWVEAQLSCGKCNKVSLHVLKNHLVGECSKCRDKTLWYKNH